MNKSIRYQDYVRYKWGKVVSGESKNPLPIRYGGGRVWIIKP